MKALLIVAFLTAALGAGYYMFGPVDRPGPPPPPPEMARVERFFQGPAQSARLLDDLLSKSDWSTIATYADWSDLSRDGRALLEHEFSYGLYERALRALAAFPTGSRYVYHRRTDDPDIVVVYVAPPGQAGAEPTYLRRYALRMTPNGYRLWIDPARAVFAELANVGPDVAVEEVHR